MRHAILGNGNLGNAIATRLAEINIPHRMFSSSDGWIYPSSGIAAICEYKPDHVWVTVGAGSVEQAKVNFIPFIDLHVSLPMSLAQGLPKATTLHLFSTDYCSVLPQSLYAMSKKWMEDSIKMLGRPNTYIYRVGSLYGVFKPESCFPYRLAKNKHLGSALRLPRNCVAPTPVDWLAETLIPNKGYVPLRPTLVAPSGCISVRGWGEAILGFEIEANGYDKQRPLKCCHRGEKMPHWRELWDARWSEWGPKFTYHSF